MVAQKENGSSPKTTLKVTGDYDLIDRQLKTAIMKKLNELKENCERKFNELRKE